MIGYCLVVSTGESKLRVFKIDWVNLKVRVLGRYKAAFGLELVEKGVFEA